MPYTLKPNKLYVKDPETGGFLPQNVIAEQTTEEMVAEIQTEGAAIKAEIVAQIEDEIDPAVDRLDQAITDAETAAMEIETQKDTIAQAIASMAQLGTDTSLSTSGMAADAKATGDEITDLKSAIDVFDVAATATDVGKALKAKTVSDGKVTEYELSDMAVVDSTLSIAGEAADAKATGDAIADVKSTQSDITLVKTSLNLLNYGDVSENMQISYSQASYGALVPDSNSLTTGFIPVESGKKYYSTRKSTSGNARAVLNVTYHAWYNENKETITVESTNVNEFVAPSNAAFLRITLRRNDGWTIEQIEAIKWMIYEANIDYGKCLEFQEYYRKTEINANSIDTEKNINDIFAVGKTRNLLNYIDIINYASINSDGSLVSNESGCATMFIGVEEETPYICTYDVGNGRINKSMQYLAYYNQNKELIERVQNVYQFTTPINCRYIRISWHNNIGYYKESLQNDKVMLEKGKYYSEYVDPDGDIRFNPNLYDYKTKKAIESVSELINAHRFNQPLNRLSKIAHRGVMRGRPENTIPAFQYAKQHGYDYCEFDVQVTADHELIIFHDKRITIDGVQKYVYEYTLAEIKTYRFSDYAGTEYENTEIPTFEEALACFAQLNMCPAIEIKNLSTETTVEDIENIYNLTVEYGFISNAMFYAADKIQLARLNKIDPWLNLAPFYTTSETIDKACKETRSLYNGTNNIIVMLPIEMLTDGNVKALRDVGANLFGIGANLGGAWHNVMGPVTVPDSVIKHIHYVMENNIVS